MLKSAGCGSQLGGAMCWRCNRFAATCGTGPQALYRGNATFSLLWVNTLEHVRSERTRIMRKPQVLLLGMSLAFGSIAVAQQTDAQQDRRDLRHDRRERVHDRRDLAQDRRARNQE